MPDNELWTRLLTADALKRGWHLTRAELDSDFLTDTFGREAFAYFLEDNICELLRALRRGEYQPRPIRRASIPKGPLATRPGTVIEIEDRVVLFAALRLVAPVIDSQLIDGAYSYRVKPKPDSERLFNESDVLAMPFVKSKTVRK
jgi:RNA-directed DNA polymerase